MKIIKPLKLGLLFKTFEYRGRCFWSPAVLVYFDFNAHGRLESEIDMWKLIPHRLGQQILDEAMPKARAEVLVNGSFFAPAQKPVPAGKVRIKLGAIDKTLFVFGNRYWKRSASLAWSITEPEPVLEVPIDWSRAFGGPDHKPNPLGKGIAPVEVAGQGKVVPLPNIEYPDQLIGSPKDRPVPAGLGPLDLTWPQRFSKCGTYDKNWFEQRFPGLADDIDWTFFNAAAQDQQIEGFFKGNENFVIEGMHPDHPRLEGQLPDIRPRCFICREQGDNNDLEELELKADTLWLFPDLCRAVVIYRGLTQVSDDTAKDIGKVMLAYEKRTDKARHLDHYRKALEKRSDPQKTGAALLDETDLIAEGEVSGIAEIMAGDNQGQGQLGKLFQKKQRLKMENDIKRQRERLAAQGLDPDDFLPLPPPEVENFDPTAMDKLLQQVEDARRQAEQILADQLEKAGLSKDEFLRQAAEKPAPRPVFSAADAVSAFESVGLANDTIATKMRQIEKIFQENYRRYGHLLPPVIPPGPETDEERIQIVTEAWRTGASLADIDLSGLNLAGMDLSGADLAGAFLEGANLAGANLAGADLSNCALMRANLAGAKLQGTKLVGSGLGRCNLERADLSGSNLTAASLAEANLAQANFVGAVCNKADFSGTKAYQADFSQTSMKNVLFLETDFTKANLRQADLSQGVFFKTILVQADLTGSILTKVTLVKVDASEADFSGCRFENLRAAAECNFEKSCFDHALLEGANLRGTCCRRASFNQTNLNRADLSQADLRQTSFYHASAKGALFMDCDLSGAKLRGANLFESLLHKANLDNTDFAGANLFGADFMKARFRNTDVRQALTAKSTLLRWMPK